MSKKKWLISVLVLLIGMLGLFSAVVIWVDPYFHYHAPNPDMWYNLSNERSQNDGITKHFQYGGMITGTSMTQNFKTTEAEKLFGVPFIKVPFAGGRFKEINDNIATALETHPDLKFVIRGLDQTMINFDKDDARLDLGEYPTYLYDNNPFNDVFYTLNKEVFVERCIPSVYLWMKPGSKGGMTTFDAYSNWMRGQIFGAAHVLSDRTEYHAPEMENEMNDAIREQVLGNIRQNVTELPKTYPDTEFYYFLTPTSAAAWGRIWEGGQLDVQIQILRTVIEEIIQCPNIHLFGFDTCFDMTTDLNNFKDYNHYHEDINSWMLEQMYSGNYQLTADNYEEYLDTVENFYHEFDFNSLFDQIPPEPAEQTVPAAS